MATSEYESSVSITVSSLSLQEGGMTCGDVCHSGVEGRVVTAGEPGIFDADAITLVFNDLHPDPPPRHEQRGDEPEEHQGRKAENPELRRVVVNVERGESRHAGAVCRGLGEVVEGDGAEPVRQFDGFARA